MHAIRKKIVTDEDARPVAVQIDYEDWLEIERLTEKTSRGRTEGVGRPLVEHTPDLVVRRVLSCLQGTNLALYPLARLHPGELEIVVFL